MADHGETITLDLGADKEDVIAPLIRRQEGPRLFITDAYYASDHNTVLSLGLYHLYQIQKTTFGPQMARALFHFPCVMSAFAQVAAQFSRWTHVARMPLLLVYLGLLVWSSRAPTSCFGDGPRHGDFDEHPYNVTNCIALEFRCKCIRYTYTGINGTQAQECAYNAMCVQAGIALEENATATGIPIGAGILVFLQKPRYRSACVSLYTSSFFVSFLFFLSTIQLLLDLWATWFLCLPVQTLALGSALALPSGEWTTQQVHEKVTTTEYNNYVRRKISEIYLQRMKLEDEEEARVVFLTAPWTSLVRRFESHALSDHFLAVELAQAGGEITVMIYDQELLLTTDNGPGGCDNICEFSQRSPRTKLGLYLTKVCRQAPFVFELLY
jgi:hypothetical protein